MTNLPRISPAAHALGALLVLACRAWGWAVGWVERNVIGDYPGEGEL